MQETRQYILEILKEAGHATVDDIVHELRKRRGDITAVTVRHHLTRLQEDDLITAPQLRHRTTPGRPQHVYALTSKAEDHFPNNYQRLAAGLLRQLHSQLSPEGVNVILEGVADDMASDVEINDVPMGKRLDKVISYLNDQGYRAAWEKADEGYVLYTYNCPYHHLTQTTDALCNMDMRLITALLGVVPRRLSRVAQGDAYCAYLIPNKQDQ